MGINKDKLKYNAIQQFIEGLNSLNAFDECDLIGYQDKIIRINENIKQREAYIKYLKAQLLDSTKIIFISALCKK